LTDPHGFADLRTSADWSALQTLVMVRRQRRFRNQTSAETAFLSPVWMLLLIVSSTAPAPIGRLKTVCIRDWMSLSMKT
jgi:hypothetical protein